MIMPARDLLQLLPPGTRHHVAARGFLATRPLFLRSASVRLNVQAAHEVRVQVTDPAGRSIPGYTFADAEPLRGNELFWSPRWRDRGLDRLAGQVVCL